MVLASFLLCGLMLPGLAQTNGGTNPIEQLKSADTGTRIKAAQLLGYMKPAEGYAPLVAA
jgi:hypothetical protein